MQLTCSPTVFNPTSYSIPAVLALGGGRGVSLQAPIGPEYHSLHFSLDVSAAFSRLFNLFLQSFNMR